jgi:two-component system, NarL family, sensor kinase
VTPSPAERAPPPEAPSEALRRTILPQLQALSAENARLLDAVARSEQRFRGLARSVWTVQEEERRRLARELHDGLGQVLTALANQLQRIHDDARAQENLGLKHRLADALEITRGALRDTRELSRLLRPTLLDDLGLDAALSWLVRTLSERTALKLQYHAGLAEQRLETEIETLVFRITQEALTNVLRHARATRGSVHLWQDGNGLHLCIEDDGCGFEPALLDDPGHCSDHSGVRGMRDRARLFGGQLEVHSQPGLGTRVQLDLPLTLAPLAG